jgi:putative DNA primase/helicase
MNLVLVRELCEIGPAKEIEVGRLYAGFKAWWDDNGHVKNSKETFGRDLRAAVPAIRKQRTRDGEDRSHVYAGIALRKPS